jgi:hypothetical protein
MAVAAAAQSPSRRVASWRSDRTKGSVQPFMQAPRRGSCSAPVKAFAHLGAVLALAGTVAATAATGPTTTPVGASRIERAAPVTPAEPIGAVGLDHAGGDLKRAVRVTRRTSCNMSAQSLSWAGVALIIPRQVTPITANVA